MLGYMLLILVSSHWCLCGAILWMFGLCDVSDFEVCKV